MIVQVPDMELEQGVYWLKGENGSGKTTLIKSIAGLTSFDGQISISGIEIDKDRIGYRKLVSYAEAEPQYPAFLTGDEMIAFFRQVRGVGSAAAVALGKDLGVNAFSANKIGTYSSGMVKKLSLVLSLMGDMKLVLLDEPLITLDVDAVAVLQQAISDRCAQGVSFLITSHQEMSLPHAIVRRLVIRSGILESL